jgi:methylmalonyl-CoA mutase
LEIFWFDKSKTLHLSNFEKLNYLKSIFNMAASLFEDFQPHSKEVWKNQAIKDLKGKDFDQTLIWQAEGDLRIEPYYNHEDLSSLPIELVQSAQNNAIIATWHNREKIIFQLKRQQISLF